MHRRGPGRRTLLSLALALMAGTGLAACGSSSDEASPTSGAAPSTRASTPPTTDPAIAGSPQRVRLVARVRAYFEARRTGGRTCDLVAASVLRQQTGKKSKQALAACYRTKAKSANTKLPPASQLVFVDVPVKRASATASVTTPSLAPGGYVVRLAFERGQWRVLGSSRTDSLTG